MSLLYFNFFFFRTSLVCSTEMSNHPKSALLCNYHLQQQWTLRLLWLAALAIDRQMAETIPVQSFCKQTWLSRTNWLQKQERATNICKQHSCQQNNKTLCTAAAATICLVCLYTRSSQNCTKAAFRASYNLCNGNVTKNNIRKQLPSHVLHFPSQGINHSLQGSRSY